MISAAHNDYSADVNMGNWVVHNAKPHSDKLLFGLFLFILCIWLVAKVIITLHVIKCRNLYNMHTRCCQCASENIIGIGLTNAKSGGVGASWRVITVPRPAGALRYIPVRNVCYIRFLTVNSPFASLWRCLTQPNPPHPPPHPPLRVAIHAYLSSIYVQ